MLWYTSSLICCSHVHHGYNLLISSNQQVSVVTCKYVNTFSVVISLTACCSNPGSRLTCDAPILVSADLQLFLLVHPQLQQEPGSRLSPAVPPAEDVRQSVRVVTQLQQGGQDVTVQTPGARLLDRETQVTSYYSTITSVKLPPLEIKIMSYLR